MAVPPVPSVYHVAFHMPTLAQIHVPDRTGLDQRFIPLRQERHLPIVSKPCFYRVEVPPDRGKEDRLSPDCDLPAKEVTLIARLAPDHLSRSRRKFRQQLRGAARFRRDLEQAQNRPAFWSITLQGHHLSDSGSARALDGRVGPLSKVSQESPPLRTRRSIRAGFSVHPPSFSATQSLAALLCSSPKARRDAILRFHPCAGDAARRIECAEK